MGDEPWEDQALVQTVAHDIRATIQEELLDMVGKRALGLVRMSAARSRRILHHRACRPTGAAAWPRRSSSDPEVEAIIGDRHAAAEGRARAHGVRAGLRRSTR